MQDLLKDRREDKLPVLKRSPLLSKYWDEYLNFYDVVKDAKRPKTLRGERYARDRWLKHLGEIRLNEITRANINAFIAKRQSANIAPRTVNADVISLRVVLRRALEDGWLKTLPMDNLKPLKVDQVKRSLITGDQLEKVIAEALLLPKSGQMLADVLRFTSTSGARIAETLRLRWSDVDFSRRQISIGADGLAKNRKSRVVDLSAPLEAHLKNMHLRRPQDSTWLFPSPRRGKKDVPLVNFNKALRSACAKAGLQSFGFHDCRHFFISNCVMSGIDYMTIARWVGHQDGGVLIGKVYGHLADEHTRRQAERLVLPATRTPDNSKIDT